MEETSKLNDAIFTSYNEDYFFNKLLKNGNGSLELIVTDECDHKCQYCYYKKYGNYFFNEKSRDKNTILNNLDLLLNWLKEKNYYPNIDLFSGEMFSTDVGFECVEKVINYMNPYQRLVVATNMSFIFDDEKVKRVEVLKDKANTKMCQFILSASVDGKYMEENRPLKDGRKRDDVYYDKLFKFCKKHTIGFHPMVYSSGIEKWKDNFLWFMEMLEKYGMDKYFFYLLEVRNKEWTIEQTKEYVKFLEFLMDWIWEDLKKDKGEFVSNISKNKVFNIISAPFLSNLRGLGCSIQTFICITLGDLTIPNCHRLAYSPLIGGRFVVENNKIVGMKAENFVTYMNIKSFESKTQPYCKSCLIKQFCQKGCLGSQYETTGNMFTPIPTVCRLYHGKIFTLLKKFKEFDILSDLLCNLTVEQSRSIRIFEKEKLL